MPKDKRIDEYIAKAGEFAQLILARVREIYHDALPEVEESMKWSTPHFDHHGIVGNMAAFKKHVSIGFWNAEKLPKAGGKFEMIGKTAMMRMKASTLSDLPTKRELTQIIKKCAAINAKGERPKSKPAPKKPTARAPKILTDALKANPDAKQHWDAFSPGKKRDYIEWITEAKTDATRDKRLATTIEWVSEGKPRNWKYMKKWQ